ncbi:MAG: uroporphyrinogen-III C-methyltransferase [Burkholderiaceae bacterium]|nr:uroporphyrinogen-III C-methyltransferase [Burkholderiaceae bacterium]
MTETVHEGSAAPQAAVNPPVGKSRWLGILAMATAVAALGALVWAGTLSQRLATTQQEMARRTADTLAEVVAARNAAMQAESVSKELAARLGVAELRLSEVSLQRTQLEELMLSVSRSRDDSLVQDIESTVRLAIQQSQLTGSAQPLISALLGAEQRIERAAQPRLNPVQRAIARDIERLRVAELVDVPALVTRIDELLRQADEWPLRNAPLTIRPTSLPTLELPEEEAPAMEEEEADAPVPPGGLAARQWVRFNAWRADLTSRWLQNVRASTADLVRVSRIDHPEAALLAPEQSYLLRENIKFKLLNARLGLLGRQLDTARADILNTRELVYRFFDDSSPAVRMALQSLAQLHADIRQESVPRPDETLGALAVAASGR